MGELAAAWKRYMRPGTLPSTRLYEQGETHVPQVLATAMTHLCSGQPKGYVNPGIQETHAFLLIHFRGSGGS